MIVEQSQMYYQSRKSCAASLTLCVSAIFSACQNLPVDNLYDHRASEVTQAPSVIRGEFLTSLSPPIFTDDAVIFNDDLVTQEPESLMISIFVHTVRRLSSNEIPQYSSVMSGTSLYWFDDRYFDRTGLPLGTAITHYEKNE